MTLQWLSTTKDKSALTDHVDGPSRCLIHVYVDSCHDLKSAALSGKSSSKPSPMVELQVGNGEPQATWPVNYEESPVFEQGFVFTVANPHADDLHIKVIDSGHKNAVIGTTTIRTSNIMAAVDMEYRLQSFDLKRSGPVQSGIKLAANVRILQNSRPKKISDALAAQSSLDRGQQDQGSAKKASAAGQPEVMKKQKSPTPDPKVPIQEVASEESLETKKS